MSTGTMHEDDFVAASIALQLGDLGAHPLRIDDTTRAAAVAGSSGSALIWDAAGERPHADNGWTLNSGKIVNENKFVNTDKALGTLNALRAAGADFDMVIDMQDRRLRNLIPTGDTARHPVICFNRRVGDMSRILWPLPGYHDLDAAGFLGPYPAPDVPWADRQAKIAWRGNLNGRPDPYGDPRREGPRLKPLMRKHARGQINDARLKRAIHNFPRMRVVAHTYNDARFDVGFTGADSVDLNIVPYARDLMRAAMPQAAFFDYRYVLVLRGMDVGSSFYWTLRSGALALVQECAFETFGSGHFKPWKHYVPFAADMSDFDERVDWCLSHDAEAQEMAQNARAVCELLARGDLRDRIARGVVDGIRAAL